MKAVVLGKEDRVMLIMGLDKQLTYYRNDIHNNPNIATIISDTKKIELIGKLKERLQAY